MEQAALRLLNINGADTPPVAACSYAHDFGALPEAYCLRADPVHLQVDTHGLVVFDCTTLAVQPEESRQLATTLGDHLAQDGWALRFGDKCRWYLIGPEQDLTGPAICQVRGQHTSVSALVGKDARQWTGRLNELQMLMAADSFNTRRQSDQRKAINSMWIWGGGKPACRNSVFDGVVSEDSAVLGAAALNEVKCIAADNAAALLEQAGREASTYLVTLEDCRTAAAYENCEAWNQALQRLEKNWFEPLHSALSANRLDCIELSPLNGLVYHLKRTDLWKFWRKNHDYRTFPQFRQASATRT